MKIKFTKFIAEQILETVLRKEGATDEDIKLWRWQIVAYGDDVAADRLDICTACRELKDWFLAS